MALNREYSSGEQHVQRLISAGEVGVAVMKLFERLSAGRPSDEAFVMAYLPGSLCLFSDQLLARGERDKVVWLWSTAIELAGGHCEILIFHYAKYLFHQGMLLAAAEQFVRCMGVSRRLYHACWESLENLKSFILDRWHFSMLNDIVRNKSYNSAIAKSIQDFRSSHAGRGPVVLDVGGGTGLLSMFAARAGASRVYCCEMSEALCEVAQRCVIENGFADRITIIRKHSTSVTVGCEMREKADIVVTELMDSGLLGEHIVGALCDARQRLLVPGGKVIPHDAELFGCFVDCPEMRHRQTMLPPMDCCATPLAELAFKVLSLQPRILATDSCLGGDGIVNRDTEHYIRRRYIVDESYTCDKICGLRYHISALSPVLPLGRVLLNGNPQSHVVSSGAFKPLQKGSLDALIYWYELHTLPPDTRCVTESTTSFTTSPFLDAGPLPRSSGWDQAIAFLGGRGCRGGVLGDEFGFSINDSERDVHYSLRLNNEKDLLEIIVGDSVVTDDAAWSVATHRPPLSIRVGEMDICMLNDWDRTEFFLLAMLESIALDVSHDQLCLLELSGHWLSFASVMMRILCEASARSWQPAGQMGMAETASAVAERVAGAANRYKIVSSLIFCTSIESNSSIEDELQQLSLLNDVMTSRNVADGAKGESSEYLCSNGAVCMGSLREVGAISSTSQNASSDSSGDLLDSFIRKLDSPASLIIICDLVEGSGLIRQGILRDVQHALTLADSSALRPKVSLVPQYVGVTFTLVQWEGLWNSNRAKPDTTDGIRVQGEVNQYGSTVIREVDFRSSSERHFSPCFRPGLLAHEGAAERFLSESLELYRFNLGDLASLDVSGAAASPALGDLDSLISRTSVSLPVAEDGVMHAVAVWYCMYSKHTVDATSTDCLVLCTGPSDSAHSHFRQVAFLLDSPTRVAAGDVISIEVILDSMSGVWCSIQTPSAKVL